MSQIKYVILLLIITASSYSFTLGPKDTPGTVAPAKDSVKKNDPASVNDPGTVNKTPENVSNTQQNNSQQNSLQIDTAVYRTPQQTIVPADTVKKIDSTLINNVSENTLTNTKLFIYILLSVIGLSLFFYIFVITLFKTFHKKKSTRQSLLLSWNLFFIVTIIWIFIIWGLVAGFWTAASFMIVVIFLFIISLIMTIIAIKSK